MIEDGRHLINCLCYVDMNMVRSGVVDHPSEWRWCGYDELNGTRQRYRIIDIEKLLRVLNLNSHEKLSQLHNEGIQKQIKLGNMERVPHWTEALAVGSKDFIGKARNQYQYRQSFVENDIGNEQKETWMLRETLPVAYKSDFS